MYSLHNELCKKGESQDRDRVISSFTIKVFMTVQSTSQVPFSTLEGKAYSLLSHYQMEASIYTYEHWPHVSFALHPLEGTTKLSLIQVDQIQKMI